MEEVKLTPKEETMQKVGPLLPANWIGLNDVFTPTELRLIANEVEKNYKQVKKQNGSTK